MLNALPYLSSRRYSHAAQSEAWHEWNSPEQKVAGFCVCLGRWECLQGEKCIHAHIDVKPLLAQLMKDFGLTSPISPQSASKAVRVETRYISISSTTLYSKWKYSYNYVADWWGNVISLIWKGKTKQTQTIKIKENSKHTLELVICISFLILSMPRSVFRHVISNWSVLNGNKQDDAEENMG